MASDPLGAAAGGTAAVAALGAALVVRRRRPAPVPTEPESDVAVDDCYAEADPSQVLAQKLLGGGAGDTATVIATRLSRAYAAVFEEKLGPLEQVEAVTGVSLVSTRHGRSATTLLLAAPMAARPHLLRQLPEAAARAFGDEVDVDGVVSHEGDVLLRLTGVARQAARFRLIDADEECGDERLVWAEPRLVPLGLLFDRQTFAANWDELSHVLVAAPLRQGADVTLTGLIGSLAARCAPSDLGLVTIAGSGSLPKEIAALPHQLLPVVDPGQADAVLAAIAHVRDEFDRRVAADLRDEPDVVLVVRELGDLGDDAVAALVPVLTEGPRYRVRLLAATEQDAAGVARQRPLLAEVATRVVLQTTDEDESVALLGQPGAEDLASGGMLLVRVEGRLPVQAYGFRVAPDRLDRLVKLMAEAPPAPEPPSPPESGSTPSREVVDVPTNVEAPCAPRALELELSANGRNDGTTAVLVSCEPAVPDGRNGWYDASPLQPREADAVPAADACADNNGELQEDGEEPADVATDALAMAPSVAGQADPSGDVERPFPASELLRQLDQAPLQVRTFGAREVWYGDTLLWPRDNCGETPWEPLILLGVHPVMGVQSETLVDSLAPRKTLADPTGMMRKRRWRLRVEIKRLVPGLDVDPIVNDVDALVYKLDTNVVASDAHRFMELCRLARTLPRPEAIAAYEEALALYTGELLERSDIPNFYWLYDGPAVGLNLRSYYRRKQEETRRLLADLRAEGSDDADLRRAEELYRGLTAERTDDEQLWAAWFRTLGRLGDLMGLDASVRRLRTALVELGSGDDPDTVALPPTLARVLDDVRASLGRGALVRSQ